MNYQSPFSIRYGSEAMRSLWSEESKRRAWRRVWLAAAEAQAAAGLVTPAQVDDIRSHADAIDLRRAAEIEAEIGHDLMAELRVFSEQSAIGGAVLHWGMTSADVEDNAEVARQKAALTLLLTRLRAVLLQLADRIEETADLPILAYTHLQPAEPTTLGYRLGAYGQDLLSCFNHLARLRASLRGKGIRGAVGTAAPFVEMLSGTTITPEALEATVMESLGLEASTVSTQTYPRLQDYWLLSSLAGVAAAMHKFAFDLRLMQSPGLGPASEPFGERQVGSSAMPFKRNPVKSEKICSLARQVAAGVAVAWSNAALALLERTLDDSANRRSLIPEAFLACDEMLATAADILGGLQIDRSAAARGLQENTVFAATERLLNALVRAGAERQAMHERLREHCQAALESERLGQPPSLDSRLTSDTSLLRYLQPARIRELLDVSTYIGLAPQKARALAGEIRARLRPDASESQR